MPPPPYTILSDKKLVTDFGTYHAEINCPDSLSKGTISNGSSWAKSGLRTSFRCTQCKIKISSATSWLRSLSVLHPSSKKPLRPLPFPWTHHPHRSRKYLVPDRNLSCLTGPLQPTPSILSRIHTSVLQSNNGRTCCDEDSALTLQFMHRDDDLTAYSPTARVSSNGTQRDTWTVQSPMNDAAPLAGRNSPGLLLLSYCWSCFLNARNMWTATTTLPGPYGLWLVQRIYIAFTSTLLQFRKWWYPDMSKGASRYITNMGPILRRQHMLLAIRMLSLCHFLNWTKSEGYVMHIIWLLGILCTSD